MLKFNLKIITNYGVYCIIIFKFSYFYTLFFLLKKIAT